MVCSFSEKPPLSSYISTRWYRAPEVILTHGFYGPPVDVWALGCIYYEILTLKPLFPGTYNTLNCESFLYMHTFQAKIN